MRHQIKYILLLTGILLTLAYIVSGGVLFSHIYIGVPDADGNLYAFRDDLRSQGWTLHLTLLTTAIAWVFAILFYYIINSVNFDRWWNWFIVLGVSSALSAWGSITMLRTLMEELSPGLTDYYSSYLTPMAGWVALFTAIFFTIASFSCRWWSSNCRHTPFPQ